MSSLTSAAGQNQPAEDLKAVVQSGRVSNNVYSNSHVGLKLKLPQNPPCDAKLNTFVNTAPPGPLGVTVLNCVHYVQGMAGMYTFTVSVEYPYPNASGTTDLLVRYKRHSLMVHNPTMHTVQTEQTRRIADRDFVEIVMSNDLRSGGQYYLVATFTQFSRYLLMFQAAAPTVDAARALLKLDGKLDLSERH